MFKNAQLYRLPAPWDISAAQLGAQLSTRLFHPCGAMDYASAGWVPITDAGNLVHVVGQHWLMALQIEQKLLPASVINQEAAERAKDIESAQGFKPGRKQMKEIKAAIEAELLPKAFVRRRRVHVWIDPIAGWLVVDAASLSAAEPAIEVLHKTVAGLALKYVNTKTSPAFGMTTWLSFNGAANGFTIDQDCVLQAVTDEASAVRYSRHSLDGEDVRDHLISGKMVASLAMTYDNRVSFVLTDKLEIKRIKLLDLVTAEAPDCDTKEEQFDADFALMAGELSRLIPDLIDALGGEVAA